MPTVTTEVQDDVTGAAGENATDTTTAGGGTVTNTTKGDKKSDGPMRPTDPPLPPPK